MKTYWITVLTYFAGLSLTAGFLTGLGWNLEDRLAAYVWPLLPFYWLGKKVGAVFSGRDRCMK